MVCGSCNGSPVTISASGVSCCPVCFGAVREPGLSRHQQEKWAARCSELMARLSSQKQLTERAESKIKILSKRIAELESVSAHKLK